MKIVIQLLHFALEGVIVQPHEAELVAAEAQSVDKRVNICDHAVLRLTGDFQLDDTLGLAAHESGVVDDTRGALNTGNEVHHPDNQYSQHDCQCANGGVDDAGAFLFGVASHVQ